MDGTYLPEGTGRRAGEATNPFGMILLLTWALIFVIEP
jgi:hypothetical protein